MKAESQPTAQQMMRGLNSWACVFLGVALLVSGELFKFIEFVTRHPIVINHITLLALTGALGQLFIYLTVSTTVQTLTCKSYFIIYQVTEFGPLPCSIITTTRKFFTVIASILIFGNKISSRQWLGAFIVFSGLFMDVFFAKSPPKKK